jgi:tetratricopeptide (TPR) repeat protein
MFNDKEFNIFVTVTAMHHFPNRRRLFDGEICVIHKEPDNPYDKYAIGVFGQNGQVGYIANSNETLREGTMSATQLFELMEDESAHIKVVECSYHDALCKVMGILDVDKMTLKAFDYYNKFEYEAALEIFLELGKKYSTVFLYQYLSDCFIKLERWNEALPFLEDALNKEPDNKICLMMCGICFEKLLRFAEAKEIYLKIRSQVSNEEVEKAIKRCEDAI